MRIEMRPIDSIRPYPGNPRINDDAVASVAASVKEFGFRQPIVVDVDGMTSCIVRPPSFAACPTTTQLPRSAGSIKRIAAAFLSVALFRLA
ncbi:MAG: ParB N-terminal domain-containing protein [Pirellulales bacterium]